MASRNSKKYPIAKHSKIKPAKDTVLQSELEERFLSYALSTIVSRALPDVRDGLKPVHRRVLYSMDQLGLSNSNRHRKSAAVVGDVIGKFHPHGDQAAYDTMVRMAQEFSLRYPLIDGSGNFGNIDGDPAAAMRYTEARLSDIADELLNELKLDTVDFTETYDGTNVEPKILPARLPNLLINGSVGIAVGMATNIPPHNLTETINACIALINSPNLKPNELIKYIKGPDFPTGGQLISTKSTLKTIYETGQGSFKVRGEWKLEKLDRNKWQIIINSIPYSVNKNNLIEKIADHIISKKLQAVVDIRDESTEVIRIVLEPKNHDVDPGRVMTYLFKHTDMQINFAVNLTALTKGSRPLRLSLLEMLKSFLDFRLEVTTKKLSYKLSIAESRIHILKGYANVYRNLDQAISTIRKAKTRDQAKLDLMEKFKLDKAQATAILDLRLAMLVGLEISKIKKEKLEKEAERKFIKGILASKAKLWIQVKNELQEVQATHGDKRRTKIVTSLKDEIEYSADDFIEHEDTHLIVSKDGWIRRVKNIASLETLRFRAGDSLHAWMPMSTRDIVCFFTSQGKVYGIRALELTKTTGFGDPIQSFFKFSDKERIISVVRVIADSISTEKTSVNDYDNNRVKQESLFDKIDSRTNSCVASEAIGEGSQLLAVTENGMGFRFLGNALGTTNRNGKKIVVLKNQDILLTISAIHKKMIFALSNSGKGLLFEIDDIPLLAGPGAGSRTMMLKKDEKLIGCVTVNSKDKIVMTYVSGKDDLLTVARLKKGTRGTVGRIVAARRKRLSSMRKA